jgi:hypothetical protein
MDTISLDVGGTIFKTTKQTLQGSSYFRSLFDRWDYKATDEKPYFIDRSGILFEHVLSFLRNPEYSFPLNDLLNIYHELDFYGINYDKDALDKWNTKIDFVYNYVKEVKGLCMNYVCMNPALKEFLYCGECGIIIPHETHPNLHCSYFCNHPPLGKAVIYNGKLYYRSDEQVDSIELSIPIYDKKDKYTAKHRIYANWGDVSFAAQRKRTKDDW